MSHPKKRLSLPPSLLTTDNKSRSAEHWTGKRRYPARCNPFAVLARGTRFFSINWEIHRIYDLLRFFPRRYQDFSKLKTINQLEYGDELSVIGTLKNDLYTRDSKRGKLKIIEGVLSDSTGSIKLTWFNQPYLARSAKGSAIVVSGRWICTWAGW